MDDLTQKKCTPCSGDGKALSPAQCTEHLTQLNNWELLNQKLIQKTFLFKGYLRTISFVNAIAWIANQQNHHPDLEVSYNQCTVKFTTHAIDGLTENDFICAAKIDQLSN